MDVETATDAAHLLHVVNMVLLSAATTTPTKPVVLLRPLAVAIRIPTLEVATHMRVLAALPVAMAMVEAMAAMMTDDIRIVIDRHATFEISEDPDVRGARQNAMHNRTMAVT